MEATLMSYIFVTAALLPPMLAPFVLILLEEVVSRMTVHWKNFSATPPPKVTPSRGTPSLLLSIPVIRWSRSVIISKIWLIIIIICYLRNGCKKNMKYLPDGSYLVVYSIKDGVYLYSFGYKYSSLKVLCFISTEGCRSEFTGKTYEALWTDRHANSHPQLICCPQIISSLF